MSSKKASSKHARAPAVKEPIDNDNEQEPMVPAGLLPSYLAEAFGELYGEDGLLVLGKGLGLLSLLASFVRFYSNVDEGHVSLCEEKKQKPPLIFVLGLRETERNALVSILTTWGTPPELLPTMITNESGQGKDRAVAYQRGGVFIITTRILIVDLLTNVVTSKDIDGMLVAHAEHVNETSTEAFILRIYRTQTQLSGGFVKGFSDAADTLMSGFAKVDKILKALHVRRLYLYPRFHATVADELERRPPHVDELHQVSYIGGEG
jgi:DNA excision repair protein ERCC-4